MELLIAALVTLGVRGAKYLSARLGEEITSSFILIFAFCLSVLGTFLYKHFTTGIDLTNIESIISVFGVSMAYYEIVVKRLIKPILDKNK